MLRKILLITGILSVTLVSAACLGGDETAAPKPESYPTLLPLVMAIPTETYLPAYSLATPTPTPWPTKVPKSEVVSVVQPTPEPPPTATPTKKPISTMRDRSEITRKVTPAPSINPAPLTLTRDRAIWMASHGLSLARQNLEGVDLSNHGWGGVNFAFANLRGADFSGAILRRANLRNADLTGADLTGADLAGADFTGADITGASFKDLSQLDWIDRELALTGQLPPIPNWLEPFVAKTAKGDSVAQGQEIMILSDEDWCWLKPTEKLMLMDYAVWLGNNIDDWLDEQYEIRRALDRCPPASSDYWATKRPKQ